MILENHKFLDLLDEADAAWLAPASCRKSFVELNKVMSSLNVFPSYFLEFALLGDPGFDTTWTFLLSQPAQPAHPDKQAQAIYSCVSPEALMAALMPAPSSARSLAQGMMHAEIQASAHPEPQERIVMVEYDTSQADALTPSFHFSDIKTGSSRLKNNLAPLLTNEQQRAQFVDTVQRLHAAGYDLRICSIMPGRAQAPIRLMIKPPVDTRPQDFLRTLEDVGFSALSTAMAKNIETLLDTSLRYTQNFGFPLVHLDLSASGELGATLGLEFGGIRRENAEVFPALCFAREWGLTDERWQDLVRVAQYSKDSPCFCQLNTIKLRWSEGEPLPVKLYLMVR